jgi:probable HAF family extracellular repeat protein
MVDLGTFGGGNGVAYASNNMGQIAGGASRPSNERRPFLWTPSTPGATTGTMVDLGTLPGGVQTEAQGINALGQVVGYAVVPDGVRAFLWSPDRPGTSTGTMTDISGGAYAHALAINDLGQVVGAGPQYAFLWTAAQGMVSLGTLPGKDLSVAYCINNAGQVVGAAYAITYDDPPSRTRSSGRLPVLGHRVAL